MIDLSRLLCALGGHLAGTGTRWNHGYAFSRCRRCEQEIVRPLFGRWRLPPRGYRIVWRQADTPAGGTARRPPLKTTAYRSETPPIGDFMDDEGTDFRWTADRPRQYCPRPPRHDFMHDEPSLPPRIKGRR